MYINCTSYFEVYITHPTLSMQASLPILKVSATRYITSILDLHSLLTHFLKELNHTRLLSMSKHSYLIHTDLLSMLQLEI